MAGSLPNLKRTRGSASHTPPKQEGGMVQVIFISCNENNEPAWFLILDGRKTVTRRLKPMPVGKEFAVCPGRGKKAVCRARVISCMKHEDWLDHITPYRDLSGHQFKDELEKEAHLEGFESWAGLLAWFDKHKIDIKKTWRIEFKVSSLAKRKKKGK